MKYAAVLFDLDGTLVDTLGLYEDAYRHMIESLGCTMTHEQFLENYKGNTHITTHLTELGVEEREDEAREIRDTTYCNLLREKTEWFDDGKEFIESLPTDTPTAIITGSWKSYTDAIDEKLSIYSLTDIWITAGDMRPHSKPDPYGLLLACEQLGVDPTACIYIGDQSFDAGAAHNAGMESCIVKRPKYSRVIPEDTTYVVDALTELTKIL